MPNIMLIEIKTVDGWIVTDTGRIVAPARLVIIRTPDGGEMRWILPR